MPTPPGSQAPAANEITRGQPMQKTEGGYAGEEEKGATFSSHYRKRTRPRPVEEAPLIWRVIKHRHFNWA